MITPLGRSRHFDDRITRREILVAGGVSLLGLSFDRASPTQARQGRAASTQAVKSTPDVIIYDGTYPGWPWVSAGADGTFYCVFREGTAHGYSPTGRALVSKSTDKGK